MPGPFDVRNIDDSIRTTDATVTTAATYSVGDDSTARIDVLVLARSTTGISAFWEFVLFLKTVATGDPAWIGGTFQSDVFDAASFHDYIDLLFAAEDTDWNVAVPISAGTVNVDVTGEASTTIDWFVHTEIRAYGG